LTSSLFQHPVSLLRFAKAVAVQGSWSSAQMHSSFLPSVSTTHTVRNLVSGQWDGRQFLLCSSAKKCAMVDLLQDLVSLSRIQSGVVWSDLPIAGKVHLSFRKWVSRTTHEHLDFFHFCGRGLSPAHQSKVQRCFWVFH